MEFFENRYGLDLRSLALFRMVLALLVVGDLVLRARDMRMFYTDFGVLPRDVAIAQFTDPWVFSLHFMSGTLFVQALLFLMAGLFGAMLFFGYRTRFATVMSWLLLISLQGRINMLLQGGDVVFRLLLFWSMFLPLGAKYSIDAALDTGAEKPPTRLFTAATLGLMAQVAMVYLFSVLWKAGPDWRVTGDAVWYALSLEQFGTALGRFMHQFPDFLRVLTYGTLAIEGLAPLLLFFPFKWGPVRTASILFLIGLQISFGLHLRLGHFPFIASAMMLPLLPTWFWEKIKKQWAPLQAVYYDETCPFCFKLTRILKSFFLPDETPLLPAQSVPEIKKAMDEHHSWVVVDPTGRRLYRVEGVAAVLQQRRWGRPVAALVLWKPVLDSLNDLYEWVANHRPQLSRAVEFLKPRPVRWRISPVANFLAAVALLYVIVWNFHELEGDKLIPAPLRVPAFLLRLDQHWGMFAPNPLKDDGWYAIKAKTRDGREIDVWRDGEPFSMQRRTPQEVADQYPNERWRKYFNNLYLADFAAYRIHYGRYVCRNWNESHVGRDQIVSFQLYFFIRTNQPPGVAQPEHEARVIHEHNCF
jgi:predicted DCC family thiol-disulfide oxidoreductase YuxK